jgi:hypothetical protein
MHLRTEVQEPVRHLCHACSLSFNVATRSGTSQVIFIEQNLSRHMVQKQATRIEQREVRDRACETCPNFVSLNAGYACV